MILRLRSSVRPTPAPAAGSSSWTPSSPWPRSWSWSSSDRSAWTSSSAWSGDPTGEASGCDGGDGGLEEAAAAAAAAAGPSSDSMGIGRVGERRKMKPFKCWNAKMATRSFLPLLSHLLLPSDLFILQWGKGHFWRGYFGHFVSHWTLFACLCFFTSELENFEINLCLSPWCRIRPNFNDLFFFFPSLINFNDLLLNGHPNRWNIGFICQNN